MESLHFGSNELGFSGSFSLGMLGSSGNTDKTSGFADGHAKWNYENHANFILGDYLYGESNGIRDTNKSFIHFRHTHDITHTRNAWELFAQATQNEFTRLSLRLLGGGGFRMPLHKNDKADFRNFLGLGALYSIEDLEDEPSLTDGGEKEFIRGNFYVLTRYKYSDNTRFLNTFYYQPDLTGFDDFRILEVATIKNKIDENLDLKLSFTLVHDSKPAQTIDNTDTNYLVGVEYTF